MPTTADGIMSPRAKRVQQKRKVSTLRLLLVGIATLLVRKGSRWTLQHPTALGHAHRIAAA